MRVGLNRVGEVDPGPLPALRKPVDDLLEVALHGDGFDPSAEEYMALGPHAAADMCL